MLEVQKNHRGPQLIVSRTHRNLLRRLFEIEVPEIYTGAVEIKSIAREPGLRSKVAVSARQEGVDPVGSCVGMRGVRIQNIVNELYGEKIRKIVGDFSLWRCRDGGGELSGKAVNDIGRAGQGSLDERFRKLF